MSNLAVLPPPDPEALFAWFRAREGSYQIASAFALRGLARWAQTQQWRRRGPMSGKMTICDVGHGIGTTTAILVWWTGLSEVIAVEDDLWCREQAKQNLGPLGHRVLWYDKIPHYMDFDLLVIDGPQIGLDDWGCVARGGMIFFEGGRRDQRAQCLAYLKTAGRPHAWAQWKPADRSKGYTVILCEPTDWEVVHFRAVRIREWVRDVRAKMRGKTIGKRRAYV